VKLIELRDSNKLTVTKRCSVILEEHSHKSINKLFHFLANPYDNLI